MSVFKGVTKDQSIKSFEVLRTEIVLCPCFRLMLCSSELSRNIGENRFVEHWDQH